MSNSLLFPFLRKTIALIFVMLFLTTTFAFAGVLQLISGKSVEGEIILRNEELVKIDTGSGIPITYYLDEISTINGKSVAPVEDQVETVEKIEAPRITEQPAETIKAPKKIVVIEPAKPVKKPTEPKEIATPETVRPAVTVEIPEKKTVDVKILPDKDVAIKPKERLPVNRTPKAVRSKEQYLMRKIGQWPEEVKGPVAKADQERKTLNVALQKTKLFIKKQAQGFKENIIYLQQKLPVVKEKFSTIKEKLYAIPVQVRRDLLSIFAIFLGVTYIFTCFPLMKIAKKLDRKWTWLIWVPIIQIFYFIRMTDKPWWWTIFLFLPALNVFIVLYLFIRILRLLGRSSLFIVPIIIPGVNILTLWYLALSKKGQIQEVKPVLRMDK